MNIADTTNELKAAWALLFPKVEAPADEQWTTWLLKHSPDTVRLGLAETGARYQKLRGRMDRDYMLRFASSVMNRHSDAKKGRMTNEQMQSAIQALATLHKDGCDLATIERLAMVIATAPEQFWDQFHEVVTLALTPPEVLELIKRLAPDTTMTEAFAEYDRIFPLR